MNEDALNAILAGFGVGQFVVSLVIAVISIVGMWKMFEKAGKPGWASIVPFYNLYMLFDIAWGNGILFLTMLVPCVNLVFSLICLNKLARAFGKGVGFFIGLIFLGPIFYCILGFGDAEYIGPQ